MKTFLKISWLGLESMPSKRRMIARSGSLAIRKKSLAHVGVGRWTGTVCAHRAWPSTPSSRLLAEPTTRYRILAMRSAALHAP